MSAPRADERFRKIFENAATGIAITDWAGKFQECNPAYCALLGYTEEELRALDFSQLVYPEDREANLREIRRLKEGELPCFEIENRYVRKDGRPVWVHKFVSVLHGEPHGGIAQPAYLLALVTDITERRRGEESLRESEERFRRLADAMPQLVWTALPDGTVDYYNSRAREYAGVTRAADGTWTWQVVLHPADREATLRAWERAVATGQPYECEHRVRMADGRFRWHLSRGMPVKDGAGRVVRWFGTATDVHELKRAHESLREADRRKDEFLAMLAHELRNPLAPIRNAVHILRMAGPKIPVLDNARDIIDRQVTHLTRLVDDLLDVSRVSRGKIELQRVPCDLRDVARQAVETAQPLINERRHELALALPEGPLLVEGDLTRLAQVVGNLLNNAAKYTDREGRIWLTVEPGAEAEAIIRVRDTGRGIDPAVIGEVFDLFYQADCTLDRSEGGLGIGLSLVRSLVSMHGGTIEARSEGRGRGSEFVVRLPCLIERAVAAEEGRAEEARAEAGLRVLVVDDNRDSAETMALLLDLEGHQVEQAHDGGQAVDAALRRRPDVVLLDIGLPVLNGYQACAAMRKGGLQGALIVAMTGYGKQEDRRAYEDAGFDALLVKPVDMEALQRLLKGGRGGARGSG
jgi:PAS domain S-box-containing protein